MRKTTRIGDILKKLGKGMWGNVLPPFPEIIRCSECVYVDRCEDLEEQVRLLEADNKTLEAQRNNLRDLYVQQQDELDHLQEAFYHVPPMRSLHRRRNQQRHKRFKQRGGLPVS